MPIDASTIGVVAISRNEIGDIAQFIQNVRLFADEIVIVDDGSSDGTVEYLATCGAPVTVVKRRIEIEGGFAAQRNAGIDAASSDWLLHMDIDERVPPDLASEIRESIRNTCLNAFRYRRLNFFLHRPFAAGGWQTWNAPQLARRGRHRFIRPIHEQVEVEGGESSIGQLQSQMLHLNDDSYLERMHKSAGYAERSAREVLERGGKVRLHHLILIPMWRAAKAYIWHGAWKHGTLGFIFGVYTFSSTFNWYACAWDMQNRIARDELEQGLISSWNQ